MTEQEKFNCFCKKYGWNNQTFFNRPHWTRRSFFKAAGIGVTASILNKHYANASAVTTNSGMTTKNTAKNVIFILLAGAPSHTDLFDFKASNAALPTPPGVNTPLSTLLGPATVNGVSWPSGLMPKLGNMLSQFSIIRSMQSHALVHTLGQTWSQIGRNPAAALGNIAPNIGSIVAIEKGVAPTKAMPFPPFVALNSSGAVSNGYLPAQWAPFKVNPTNSGIAYTTSGAGQARWGGRWNDLYSLDNDLRTGSPNGEAMVDYDAFYQAANGLMYNNTVNAAFGYSTADYARYGSTGTGAAMLVAHQILKANQGTRFVQITSNDGWDMHQNIYQANNIPAKAKLLDDGLSALLGDLQGSGLLSQTLVVMVGEFGRTVGALTAANGRDHGLQQFAFVAGGGTKSGQIIGATNTSGNDTAVYGWSQNRYVYPEDIEATIYSALGIDWTTVRHDDPLGRGFEYVPSTSSVPFYPVHELWG
jgi:hypothetical protein